jgi:predicted NACHT family NTPase
VILSGTGGLGKSMMLRHLLLDAIERYAENQIVPLFIALKDFDETDGALLDYVFSKLDGYGTEITKEQFENLLNKGKCLLLFDGLDEIGTKHGRRFEKELESFTDRYPDNRYVISSRPHRSFISYSRFTVLFLQPFSKQQALQLIDKLDFRPDEPIIKEKFKIELEQTLYWTHKKFTENPLLLTIMLMTFEQFAEVPSKMHIFYREAFVSLSQKHDASKGAYKRTFRTGLPVDKFADYFAEFCSRSYHDEKFELSETEFAQYYNNLKEREKAEDHTTTAEDFLYDLCSNMCLMYFESGKYHFTHRSFQEYFCALYFSKQKDKNLRAIGNFFENRSSRNFGDKTFVMLYDMISDKIDEYVFLPFLADLFSKCDESDGYWTFLEIMYPWLYYEIGEIDDSTSNSPVSYLYEFIKSVFFDNSACCEDFPFYDSLVSERYGYIVDENGSYTLVNLNDVDYEYKWEVGEPEAVGWLLEFNVSKVRSQPERYKELLSLLEAEDFVLKQEHDSARKYFDKLTAKQKPTGDGLFDLFQ